MVPQWIEKLCIIPTSAVLYQDKAAEGWETILPNTTTSFPLSYRPPQASANSQCWTQNTGADVSVAWSALDSSYHEAQICSIKVPTNLISTTRGCYCNQLSAPASLLPSTVLLSQRPGKLLCFSQGWISYSHQRRWQWLERCKWPQWWVQSLLTHWKQHGCLWPHQRETGALQGLVSKQHKKRAFLPI